MTEHARLAVLISGRGSNLQALHRGIEQLQIPAEVQLVVSNVAAAKGLEFARDHHIEHCALEHQSFADREQFDQALDCLLQKHNLDYVLLAGFMRILSDGFVQRWRGRLINIHPSLLPLYPGLNTHARALEAGDDAAGASVHYVTPRLDGGPVILQGKVDVVPGDIPATLATRVLEVEHIIYPMALSWLVSARARLVQNHYHLDDKIATQAPCWYNDRLLMPDQ